MSNHMYPQTKYIATFKCPDCNTVKREIFYSFPSQHRSKCRRLACLGCGAYSNLPFEVESLCANCIRRIECLLVPTIRFFKNVKIRTEEVPTWPERIARVREKGVARVAKNGNIHKALKTFERLGRPNAAALRGSRFTMWEVMMMLTYGFIEKVGRVGVKGGYYEITKLGEEARNQLDISEKRRRQLVPVAVAINEVWFEYFKRCQW